MKAKISLLSLLSLLSLASLAGHETADARTVVYQGTLINSLTGGAVAFPPGTKKNLDFRGYDTELGGTGYNWQTNVNDVTINPDGSFTVLLGGEKLAGLIATGKVTHIAVRIDVRGNSEMGSPRAFRPVVMVNRALAAEGLAADAKVGTMAAASATANMLDVAGAEISGPVTLEKGGAVTVRPFTVESGITRLAKGRGVAVWGQPEELLTEEVRDAKAGAALCKAKQDGVALVHCVDASASDVRVPGTIQFCREGDDILMPQNEPGKVAVTFWPYANVK